EGANRSLRRLDPGILLRQVVDDATHVCRLDRRAECIDHLVNALFPGGAIHCRRDHGDVVETVADRTASHGELAPFALPELNALLPGAPHARGESAHRDDRGENRIPHTTTSCSVWIRLW